jgi:hypothetical protein
LDIAE